MGKSIVDELKSKFEGFLKPTGGEQPQQKKSTASREKLYEIVKKSHEPRQSYNTNEFVVIQKEALEAAYELDDYPVLVGLEHSWKGLESMYEVVNREDHPSENPLFSFAFYVDMGFYPPPEVMLAITKCIERYKYFAGDISLDEAFFNQTHKKLSSPSYNASLAHNNYGIFHLERSVKKSGAHGFEEGLSVEKQAEIYLDGLRKEALAQLGEGFKVQDVDSFLRGYRRWKEKMYERHQDKEDGS